MKNKNLNILVFVAIGLSLILQSCGTPLEDSLSLSKGKMENKIATKSELLIDNIIKVYNDIQDISFESEFDGAVAGILSSSENSYEAKPLFSDSIRTKIQILYLYKQAVHEYALLADDGFTGQQSALANCCSSIVENYKNLSDSSAIDLSLKLNPIIRSSRYDENVALYYLMDAMWNVWTNDVKSWNDQLNRSFLDYQVVLSLIPEGSFSDEKLAKFVRQPYEGKHNLVEVYKMNLIKERRNSLNQLVQKQDNITSALQYLIQALTEFRKSSGDKTIVANYLKRIDILLDSNEVDNE